MSTYDLIQADAAVARLAEELRTNTPAARAMLAHLEPSTASCVYSETDLDNESVKTALKLLKEKGTTSAYEFRHAAKFSLNPAALGNYNTSQEFQARALLSSVNQTPSGSAVFKSHNVITAQNAGGATYTADSSNITITATGQWRLIANFGLAFYPKAKATDNVRYWTRRPHTNTNIKTMPVSVYLVVKTGANVRLVQEIATARFYREEINEDRMKFFGGAFSFAATAGDVVSFEVQRGGDFGSVYDNSTATTYKESLSPRFIGETTVAGDPLRDGSNYVTLIRLT